MSIWICGGPTCICCGADITNTDAISVCWDCMSGNFECENCFREGIRFNKFSGGQLDEPLHRFSHWTDGPKSTAVGVCGAQIPYDDLGQGIAVLKDCAECWRE